ncbi:MAG: prepilin-type N-terminal cleavage/methylation domain-containing protein [Candidatus Omnitrophota bacterium]|nr:MAG: prepilin-type N-terminal cleavage/methylation domain-containing protein [Candidatus Omnitrophota bacterium]
MRRTKNKSGFTFIELVLVTLIILIVAGLAAPLFRRPFSSIQLKNTSQGIVNLLRYAQARSIAEREIQRIDFDNFKIPEGISISSESDFINFYPDGSADKTEIKVSDNKGKTFTITTQRNTGYVKVEE